MAALDPDLLDGNEFDGIFDPKTLSRLVRNEPPGSTDAGHAERPALAPELGGDGAGGGFLPGLSGAESPIVEPAVLDMRGQLFNGMY
jgi:hypothetical protein